MLGQQGSTASMMLSRSFNTGHSLFVIICAANCSLETLCTCSVLGQNSVFCVRRQRELRQLRAQRRVVCQPQQAVHVGGDKLHLESLQAGSRSCQAPQMVLSSGTEVD